MRFVVTESNPVPSGGLDARTIFDWIQTDLFNGVENITAFITGLFSHAGVFFTELFNNALDFFTGFFAHAFNDNNLTDLSLLDCLDQ